MRLIDADKLKAHYAWWKGGTREMTMDEAKNDFDTIIDLQPTVDPIKHGYWKWNKQYGTECSECGTAMFEIVGAPYTTFEPNYCPNCGARMDLDEVEE